MNASRLSGRAVSLPPESSAAAFNQTPIDDKRRRLYEARQEEVAIDSTGAECQRFGLRELGPFDRMRQCTRHVRDRTVKSAFERPPPRLAVRPSGQFLAGGAATYAPSVKLFILPVPGRRRSAEKLSAPGRHAGV